MHPTDSPSAVPSRASWRPAWTAEGVRFVGPDGAVTVAHERPLPADLLCDQLAPRGADVHRGVTVEGEYVVRFTRDGRRVAWVLGDWHMTVIEADGPASSLAALVDTLARTMPLRRGALRPRRFEVTPPAGWRASARGLMVRLEAPDGAAFLSIPAATPLGAASDEDPVGGLEPVGASEVQPIALPCGLVGEVARGVARHRGAGAPVVLCTAVLHDDRYRYGLRLAAAVPSAAAEAVFDRVVTTVRPVPRPAPRWLGADRPLSGVRP